MAVQYCRGTIRELEAARMRKYKLVSIKARCWSSSLCEWYLAISEDVLLKRIGSCEEVIKNWMQKSQYNANWNCFILWNTSYDSFRKV